MAKAQHAQRYRLLPGMLRQMRRDAGLTQRALAEKMRVTHVSVHKSASMFTATHRELAAAVVELRRGAGLTQRQLAEAVGREQNYVGRIETGQRRVDLVEFVAICRACDADAEEEAAKLVRKIKS